MKRNLLIALVLVLATSSLSCALSIADSNNLHNMSNLATHSGPKAATTLAGGTDRVCVFCHTPHSAAPQTPLWNRPDPTTATFQLYASALAIKTDPGRTGYTTSDPAKYPSGASRMCLSCHDGATSIGVVLAGTPVTMEGGSETITNVSAVIDLATSHPISFNYNNDVLSNVLNPAKPGAYKLPDGSIDTPLDGSGQMQCTTCHDPHEDTRGAYGLPFWRHRGTVTDSYYDDVCNACHTAPTIASPPPIHNIP